MNEARISGTICKDPVVRYSQTGTTWASWTTAVPTENGKGKSFISCKAFNEVAEQIERIAKKDMYIEVQGHISTGSYTGRDGRKVYTTDVVADAINFSKGVMPDATDSASVQMPEGFSQMDDDGIPF